MTKENTSSVQEQALSQEEQKFFLFYKSIIEQDRCAIVICNPQHEILYMNPAAIQNYKRRGGAKLVGKSLLDCHNPKSQEKIVRVIEWFASSPQHNMVYISHNKRKNKDAYMVALRDGDELIGYYEKHEFRNEEVMELFDLPE